jgi:hypothetical protein
MNAKQEEKQMEEKLPEVIDNQDVAVYETSPVDIVQSIIKAGGDLAMYKDMMALQKEHDAYQGKKAFIRAMAKFKEEPINIAKDKENKQYNSKYSSIGATVNACLPRMGKCGLSHKWEFVQEDQKTMTGTCIVTHAEGYSDSVSMTSPLDVSGNKNPIQQIKSTRTYIKIETFASLMGLASSETDLDDDGNSAAPQALPQKQITIGQENVNWLMGFCKKHEILDAKTKKEFQEHYKFDPYTTSVDDFAAIKTKIESDYNEVDKTGV